MNILLVCAAGMSTSLLVNKMQKESNALANNDIIFACSADELDTYIDKYDVVLLGPQIKYKSKSIDEVVSAKGKGFGVIDTMSYGTVNGKKVLEQAYSLKK
jgi:cellobiose PTS system EIIB component